MFMYGCTFIGGIKFFLNLTTVPDKTNKAVGEEGYLKLRSIFS